jgi:hypothetical protein
MTRRFPAPWTVNQIPGGFKVVGANGQSLVYVYARETREQADIAKVMSFDEAGGAMDASNWCHKRPKAGQQSLRAVSRELAAQGFLIERGKPCAAKPVASMLR